MSQRSALRYMGIVWYYSRTPNAWIGASPDQVVTGKAGANNAIYGAGGDTLIGGGGGGDNTFYLETGDQAVAGAGDGVDTVVDYWGNLTLPAGIADGVLNHPGTIIGNSGNNILTATGAGSHTFDAGSGNTVMLGSVTGADRFVVTQGNKTDVVIGFQHGQDTVQLDNFPPWSGFTAVQQAMTQVGANVALTLGAQTLLFANATVAQFTAADFDLPINIQGWTQTFDDEFTTLNASATGFGTTWWAQSGTLAANDEAENYSNNTGPGGPFLVSNGILAITASPVSTAPGLPYTSGELTTARSFAQTYGYFEMSAELPAGQGMWPAFWLLPASGVWPPELDVLEALGSEPTTIYEATHSAATGTDVTAGLTTTVGNTTAGFNTYGVDWEPGTITYYFNGNDIGSLPTPADMHQPMYMLIDLAVGGAGSWPGSAAGESGTLLVDYVRAYASPTAPQPPLVFNNWARSINQGDGDSTITGTGYDGWITLGNGNQTITLTAAAGTAQASGDTIITGNGNQTISVAGASNTITTGDGTSTIYAGTDHAVVTIGATPSGTTVVTASGYQDTITATGDGDVDIGGGTTGAAVVALGNGDDTITLGGSGNTVTVGTGSSVIDAGDGQATVTAAGGSDTITVSGWNNVLDAGPGINFLNGGSGNDAFVLNGAGQGLDTINGFQAGLSDVLDLTRSLAGTALLPDFSNIGQFVSTETSGSATLLLVSPTGATPQEIAVLTGVSTSLSSLLANDNIRISGQVI